MNSRDEMLGLIPFDLRISPQYIAIFDAAGKVLGKASEDINVILDQTFISTATWGLELLEESQGLASDGRLSIEERRSRLISHKRSKGPVTLADFISFLNSFTPSGGSTIREYPREYRVVLSIQAGGQLHLSTISEQIALVLPAHLKWGFEIAANADITIIPRTEMYSYEMLYPGDSTLAGTHPSTYTKGLRSKAEIHAVLHSASYSTKYPRVSAIVASETLFEEYQFLGAVRASSVLLEAAVHVSETSYPIVPGMYVGTEPHIHTAGKKDNAKVAITAQVDYVDAEYPYVNNVKVGEDI